MNRPEVGRVALFLALLLLTGCIGGAGSRSSEDPVPSAADTPSTAGTEPSAPPTEVAPHVIAISVDGLSPAAITMDGVAPVMRRLVLEGASTLNARTAFEATVTLPNHSGMITGRRIQRGAGGHGVTWNVDRPRDTVQGASRDGEIESMFSVAHRAGVSTAFFAGKRKFNIYPDSWPADIAYVDIREDPRGPLPQAEAMIDHLVGARPGLTFWHLASADLAGHRHGGMSPGYLDAVSVVDVAVGRLLQAIDGDAELAASTIVILTSDHGVTPGAFGHDQPIPTNYTVPFVVWGAGVPPGDLYDLNADLQDPADGRPDYRGPQPVRNLQMAAVALDALGVPAMSDDDVIGGPLQWQ